MLTDLPIGAVVVGDRARKEVGNISILAASIERVGLLHPIVVNSRHELVAGYRRLQAAKRLGWRTVPCRVIESLDDAVKALRAEQEENVCRLKMTATEAIELGERIEALEKPEAARRKAQAKGKPQGEKAVSGGKLPQEKPGKTRDKVAAAVGVSGRTYEKGKQVVAAAREEPEKHGDLPAKMDATSVDAAYKELRRRTAEPVAVAEEDDEGNPPPDDFDDEPGVMDDEPDDDEPDEHHVGDHPEPNGRHEDDLAPPGRPDTRPSTPPWYYQLHALAESVRALERHDPADAAARAELADAMERAGRALLGRAAELRR